MAEHNSTLGCFYAPQELSQQKHSFDSANKDLGCAFMIEAFLRSSCDG